ncbi:hypothetical protein D3C72_1423090 [compost metagenome]
MMEKRSFKPTPLASSRSIFTPSEWKVDTVNCLAWRGCFNNLAIRSCISSAALLVKVNAAMVRGS